MIPLTEEILKIAITIGFGVWGLCLAFLILGWVYQYVWKWVDDGYTLSPHPLINLFKLEKREGYFSRIGHTYYGRKGKDESHELSNLILGLCFGGVVVFPLLGVLTVTLLHFYAVPLTIGVLVLVAHLSRFGRRHKKLFDKHINDPKAHVKVDGPYARAKAANDNTKED